MNAHPLVVASRPRAVSGALIGATASKPRRLGRLTAKSSALIVLAAVGLLGASSPASAATCAPGAESDFNGDGSTDLAIGDPTATVSGKGNSGRVHIAYGNGALPAQTIDQNGISGNDNAAGDRFGFSMATADWNNDGCSDLFVGVPFENWSNNTIPEAGVVVFIPGSTGGLVPASSEIWSQSDVDGANVDANETTDRFGWSVAAGDDTAGAPYLVVGVPGEDGATAEGLVLQDGGNAVYARPGKAVDFNQNSTGIADGFEDGDMFGYAVAGSPSGFTVGVPGEAAGDLAYAGTVNLLAHGAATAVPTSIAAWGQGTDGINDHYEASDMYGASLDMVDYISTTGGAPRIMVAVGAPGEMIGSRTSAGLSMVLWSSGTGITEYKHLRQDYDMNTADASETGDAFGGDVAMVNRTPGQNTGTDTLLMAVGSPGEDASGLHDVGEVGLYSMTEDVAAGGDTVRTILDNAGLNLAAGTRIGAVLHATEDHLWVSTSGPGGPAVYGVPWLNIVAGGNGAVVTHTPASLGITSGVGSFGASLA